jgi:hypothetical protein
MDGQNAGRPLHHHVAGVGKGLADERDAAQRLLREIGIAQGQPTDPLRAGASLARPAPAEHEPDGPGVVKPA